VDKYILEKIKGQYNVLVCLDACVHNICYDVKWRQEIFDKEK